MPETGFEGMRVLALESRRAKEIAVLIRNQGGEPVVAPALREAPLESNAAALAFAAALARKEFDLVVFLTGVGVRALLKIVETQYDGETWLQSLRQIPIAARGPKPLAVLRELQVPVSIAAADPFTWRELMAAIEAGLGVNVSGLRVAVNEYGAPSPDFLAALASKGSRVTRVPVYQWALPEDVEPLRQAVRAVIEGRIDSVLLTNGAQATHLFQIAEEMNLTAQLGEAFRSTVVFSIGPSTTEQLDHLGFAPDYEPSHPKMGILVSEASQNVRRLREQKHGGKS